jgi:hypothetical protein
MNTGSQGKGFSPYFTGLCTFSHLFVLNVCNAGIHFQRTDPKKVDAWLLILLAVMAAPQVGKQDGDGEGEQEGAHRVQPAEDHHHYQALQHGSKRKTIEVKILFRYIIYCW